MVILGVLLNILLILNKSMTSAPATSDDFPNFKTLKNLSQNSCIHLILKQNTYFAVTRNFSEEHVWNTFYDT